MSRAAAAASARLRGIAAAVTDGRIGVEVGDTGHNFGAAYTLGQSRQFTINGHPGYGH